MEIYKEFIKRKKKQFEEKKTVSMKDIGRKGRFYFTREAWTFMPQTNFNRKVFVIERLRKEKIEGYIAHKTSNKIGDIEYRIGYYIIGRIGKTKDKWVWGQFCPLIPQGDLGKLLKKARKEKTILN